MQLNPKHDRSCKHLIREQHALRRSRLLRATGLASLAVIAILAGAAQSGQQMPSATPDKPYLPFQADRQPDANDQTKKSEEQAQAKEPNFEIADAARRKQISDDSTRLLTLAMALKAEVDKTNKDMLSLNVIRKADEIEKLARNVKEKMKFNAGGS
jgi:hypothetical protein